MTATTADNEIWHVMIASDDVKRMNVDQLDDAFRLDLVDASTMVWKDGLASWRRLGSIAGLDDHDTEVDDELTKRAPPPPPPPRPAPLAVPIAQARFLNSSPSMHTAVTPIFPSPWPERHAPTPPRPFVAPQQLKPLVAQPLRPLVVPPMQLQAPDPYVLPKRRVAIPSDVDFRRPARGVRWGRWLVGLTLVAVGVLALYRQNLLREGARRVGLESKYLATEHRLTASVAAKSPAALTLVLTKLALLPGPNAVPAARPRAGAARVEAPSTPIAPATPQPVAAKPAAPSEPEIKTVSLDSLPVMTADPKPEADKPATAPAKAAPEPRRVVAAAPRTAPAAAKPAKAEKAEKAEAPAPVAKRKAEPVAEEPKPAPKPQAAPPPPSGNEGFLKAAIRSAIAADAAKH